MSRQYSSSDVCSEDRLWHIHVISAVTHPRHSMLWTHISLQTWATSPQSYTMISTMCLTHSMCLQPRQSSAQVSQWLHRALDEGPSCERGQLPAAIREAELGIEGRASFSIQILVCLFSNSYWYFQMALTKWQVFSGWLLKMKLVESRL